MHSDAFISVIICTYGRSAALKELLNALAPQTHRQFEVLIIDGNGEISPARETVEAFSNGSRPAFSLKVIESEKGLTRQRNVGLKAAKGNLLCFLDDDVTFDREFLARVAELFEHSCMQDVGGITPYDILGYPLQVTTRWRLRRIFGVMPDLNPGEVDHLGRAVPIAFFKPFSGYKQIGWLPGFCMIYRRAAVTGLAFDEMLPTYGGEDRDFSMRVGRRWRLLICGDLSISHHYTTQGRDWGLSRLRESSFGAGRRFAKYAVSFSDHIIIGQTFLGDFLVDVIAFLRHPTRESFLTVGTRMQAFFAGLRSVSSRSPETTTPEHGTNQAAPSSFLGN